MTKKEITIAGKEVTLAYCYATEIGFKDLADEDINDWMVEAITALQAKRMPDVKKTIYVILASMTAYYNSIGGEAPIKDTDLINEASPADIGIALGTVINLRGEFYHVPKDEPEENKEEANEKNA